MDLTDIVYIIDGSLEVTQVPQDGVYGEPVFEATLFDNIHDPCMVQGKQPEPGSSWRYGQARARGWHTEQAALEELVRLIAGDSLGHDWPVMWKSVTDWVRIPPTLVVGDVTAILNVRRPFHAEEPKPAA